MLLNGEVYVEGTQRNMKSNLCMGVGPPRVNHCRGSAVPYGLVAREVWFRRGWLGGIRAHMVQSPNP